MRDNNDHKNNINGLSDFTNETFFFFFLFSYVISYGNMKAEVSGVTVGLGFLMEILIFYSTIMYGMLHEWRRNFLNSWDASRMNIYV